MAHRTTRTNLCKICRHFLDLARASLFPLAERAFSAADATARQRGWQVTYTHGGLGRSYRDPRFDKLAACTDCLGQGAVAAGNPCRACSGTGRVVTGPLASPPPARPRGLT
jgi:hypothetical protein